MLVDASRGGEGDHAKWVEKFYSDADRRSTRFNDSCPEALEANAAAAGLTLQASILYAAVLIADDDAEPDDNKDTVKAGQELFDVMGITDTEFGEDVLGQ